MNTNILSCGIIITSPSGWLLAHASRTPRWDIPKGRQDEGETPLETAVRECFEETNIDVSPWTDQIQDLGRQSYIKGKDLHVFRLDLDEALDLSDCQCHTFIENSFGRFPETDEWQWIPYDKLFAYLGKGLGTMFIEMGLLEHPGNSWWVDQKKDRHVSQKIKHKN